MVCWTETQRWFAARHRTRDDDDRYGGTSNDRRIRRGDAIRCRRACGGRWPRVRQSSGRSRHEPAGRSGPAAPLSPAVAASAAGPGVDHPAALRTGQPDRDAGGHRRDPAGQLSGVGVSAGSGGPTRTSGALAGGLSAPQPGAAHRLDRAGCLVVSAATAAACRSRGRCTVDRSRFPVGSTAASAGGCRLARLDCAHLPGAGPRRLARLLRPSAQELPLGARTTAGRRLPGHGIVAHPGVHRSPAAAASLLAGVAGLRWRLSGLSRQPLSMPREKVPRPHRCC